MHFWPALTVISVTSCRMYRSNSGVPGPASGPRIEQFSESASALNRIDRPTMAGWARSCRAVAADPVNATRSCSPRWSNRPPMLPQTSWIAPSGSSPESDDQLDQAGRQVRGLGGRLDQARHPGDERRGELLQRPPDREVERVDLDRDPVQRGEDVLADEGPALAQRLDGAFGEDGVVRQLALGPAGVAEQHADAAVDVELGVPEGRAGAGGQRVELLAVLAQQLPERLEQRRPLVEGQLAQRRAAGRPAVVQRRRQVDARRRYPGDFLAGHRVEHRAPLVRRFGPCPAHVAAQHRHRQLLCLPVPPVTLSRDVR